MTDEAACSTAHARPSSRRVVARLVSLSIGTRRRSLRPSPVGTAGPPLLGEGRPQAAMRQVSFDVN